MPYVAIYGLWGQTRVWAYAVMAYTVMANTAMALRRYLWPVRSYSSLGLCSYGLYSYGAYSYGPMSWPYVAIYGLWGRTRVWAYIVTAYIVMVRIGVALH